MKRVGNLYSDICSYENACIAYDKAKKCKRYKPEVIEFEFNREANLVKAGASLKDMSYKPGGYKVFKVFEPKERIIMALPFRDRVVQHMVVNYIEPVFEKRFIYHSYACRKGKGVHEASDELARWIYNEMVLNGIRLYVAKFDIHHYFQSVDHEILKHQIERVLKDVELLEILSRIIDHNGIYPNGRGIPVGNLTSQLFANVYLNDLDHFVKETLREDKYIRYMDDFIIASDDVAHLHDITPVISEFVGDALNLSLNPKSGILCAKNGIDFVGYRHFADHKTIRKGAMRRMTRLLSDMENGYLDVAYFARSFESRIGSMRHADTFHLCNTYKEKALTYIQAADTVA